MKTDFELQVQAYLDGELTDREARQVADRLAGDPTAQALLAELTTTTRWLAGNEPLVPVPESREFYWSKIARALDRADASAEREAPLPAWRQWLKFLVPAAGVALAVGLAVVLSRPAPPAVQEDPTAYLVETENLSEHMTSFAFHSQREHLFVVWISNKDPQPAPEVPVEPQAVHEVIYQ